jgi:tight adherence protein B
VSELLAICVLIFAAALLAIRLLASSLVGTYRARASINRRMARSKELIESEWSVSAVRPVRGIAEFDNRFLRRLNDFLVQTGLQINRTRLFLWWLTAFLICLVAANLALGTSLKSLMIAAAASPLLLALYFRSARRRRIARFAALLPDSIDIIVRGLRVGYPLPAALDLVAREMPNPIGHEFRITCEEISFGLDINSAIDNLDRRVGQENLLFVVMAISIQSQTGGNLAQILAGLARLLRNRNKLALKVRALSADGRMSAIVLSLIPFILVGGINLISPSYFSEVRQNPAIWPALAYAALSLALGNMIMYRMVNLKF